MGDSAGSCICPGSLNAGYFLAGARKIDATLSARELEKGIAEPLDMSRIDAALGIIDIAGSDMTNAIKLVSIHPAQRRSARVHTGQFWWRPSASCGRIGRIRSA